MIREVRPVGSSEGQAGGDHDPPAREQRKRPVPPPREEGRPGSPATVVHLSDYVRTVRARRRPGGGGWSPESLDRLLDLAERTAGRIRTSPASARWAQATMEPARVRELTGGVP